MTTGLGEKSVLCFFLGCPICNGKLEVMSYYKGTDIARVKCKECGEFDCDSDKIKIKTKTDEKPAVKA